MSPDEKPLNAVPDPTPTASQTPPAAAEPDKDKTPAEIRAEIDETRAELGDTVEALAAKTDVKAQAKAKVEDVKTQAQQAQALVRQNPKPLAIAAGVVVLFLLWRWLRS